MFHENRVRAHWLGLLCVALPLRRGQGALTTSTPVHFGRRQLRRKADYAWYLAASVRVQIAKPLRMNTTGLRSQGSDGIGS
jgi:hypothetical protein